METIAIIAEYNPFHRGHAYQIQQLKKKYKNATILIIMSGSFVQRGQPALFNKFHRTRWALCNGADLIFELPTIYTLSSAEYFATGALRLANALGANYLAFGAETNELTRLKELSNLMNNVDIQRNCRDLLNTGAFYGHALRKSIIDYNYELGILMNEPNNLLAIEYLRAIENNNLALKPILIQRQGHHHSLSLSSSYPSGTALRKALVRNLAAKTIESLEKYFPTSISNDVSSTMSKGQYTSFHRYEDMLLTMLRTHTVDDLKTIQDMTEGLENKFIKASQAFSWNSALALIKSKRYSYARINRIAANLLLHITCSLASESNTIVPPYARLLGLSKKGKIWLRHYNRETPIIKKWAPFFKQLSGLSYELAQLDTRATDIQQLSMENPQYRQGGLDYIMSPIVIEH